MTIKDNAQELGERLCGCFDFSQSRVLEVGCGDGRISRYLAPHCGQLIGIEFDADVLSETFMNIPDVEVLAGSGGFLPFRAGSFDYVVFTLSLHHQDGEQALAEAKRIINPDGRIIVLEPAVDGQLERLCYLFNAEAENLREARAALSAASLIVEHEETWRTEWDFNDLNGLMEWLSEYYGADVVSREKAAIRAFLEEEACSNPLKIPDDIVMTVLRKE
jgi:SAM-dependent methyltransferase